MNPYLSFDFKSKYQSFLQGCLYFFIILACFSLHLPIAWLSISSGLIVILWILKFDYISSFKNIKRNPAALITLALLGLYLLGLVFTKASWDLGLKFFMKYTKLLLIPIIISISPSERIRSLGLKAFLFSSLTILFISYAQFFNLLPDLNQFLPKDTYKSNDAEGYIVFKGYIAHNILMAFAMFMMLCKCAIAKKLTYKIFWLSLAAMTFLNIFYLVHSRTGQIISILLIIFFLIQKFGFKYFFLALMFLVGILTFRHNLETILPKRLIEIPQEILSHHAESADTSTSAGRRLEIYKNTFFLIKDSYGIGYGTGSFEEEYAKFVTHQDTFLSAPGNPHNQYLLTLLEIGLLGLGLLLAMFYLHWRIADQLNNREHTFYAKGLIITITIGSLFNSLLLDATEGKFYCILLGLILSGYLNHKSSFYKNNSIYSVVLIFKRFKAKYGI
jgi:O-antigen ligase